MLWRWICVGLVLIFAIFWFFKGIRLLKPNDLQKLTSRIIIIVITIDCICTLFGQPPVYWQKYDKCNEFSILGNLLLNKHPLIFTLAILVWITFTTLFVSKTSFFYGFILFATVFIGHSLGAWSWLQPWLGTLLNLVFKSKTVGSNTLFWEFSQYCFYILLAIILVIVFKKSRSLH